MAIRLDRTEQVIAYFVMRSGGYLSHTKATKLLYLADRESFNRYARSITNDEYEASSSYGPTNKYILDYLYADSKPENDKSILRLNDERPRIHLSNEEMGADSLVALSAAELEILHDVWAEFGKMYSGALLLWTMDPKNLPEISTFSHSSEPLPISEILKAVGYSTQAIEEILADIEEENRVDEVFHELEKAHG